LTSPADPLAKPWLAALGGMTALTGELGAPPERVASTTGQAKGHAPLGFWGALLPYFMAQGATPEVALARAALAREVSTLETPRQEAPAAPAEGGSAASGSAVPAAGMVYYDRVLTLFGLGAAEGRYRLDTAGRLVPRWGGKTCRSNNVGSR
jgi:endoglucanase